MAQHAIVPNSKITPNERKLARVALLAATMFRLEEAREHAVRFRDWRSVDLYDRKITKRWDKVWEVLQPYVDWYQ